MLEHSFYLLLLFNSFFLIFHTESLVKISNSPWFSRIFTLQSSRWFCFIYSFWLFLRCTWKKDYYENDKIIYNHWVLKFLKNSFFSFRFLKFINFKITTNSLTYSLVEQFLETHFCKNNYRGKEGILLAKTYQNFRVYIPLTWGVGDIIRATCF